MTQPLTRLTVNLTERSHKAMLLASDETGDSRTDVANRALQVYAYLVHQSRPDGAAMKVQLLAPDGTAETVNLLL